MVAQVDPRPDLVYFGSTTLGATTFPLAGFLVSIFAVLAFVDEDAGVIDALALFHFIRVGPNETDAGDEESAKEMARKAPEKAT